ncbi:MAG: aminoacyl-tRNA hydrolase [Dehalococcoidia bacterium]|nr:aminoacyl-tRNA hydrolase [Dehalococcoidia bacterium]
MEDQAPPIIRRALPVGTDDRDDSGMAFKRPFSGGGPRFAADWLIVGLGNPGSEYAQTRHNVGWWVINELAKRAGTQPKVAGSLMAIGVGQLCGQKVALVKPKTYMNLSGKAVAQAGQWTGADTSHTVVLYDDLDMSVGALRIRQGGGHGGHNGLKSIGASVGLEFVRIKVGIGRPTVNGEPTWDPEIVAEYVLGAPWGEDKAKLDEAVKLAADAVEVIITDGVDVAANRFNRK